MSALIALFGVLLTCPPAGAQPAGSEPAAPPPASTEPAEGDQVAYETAKELYAAARKARNEEDWKRCQVKATAAWGVYQARAPLAALLGECELRLGEAVKAAGHLSLSLETDELKPALREHSAKLLDEAKQQVGVVAVTVDGAAFDAPGVTFLIDGKTAETSTLFLNPGSHTIEARHPDRGSATETLQLAAGGERTVDLTLVKAGGGGGGGGEEGGGGEASSTGYWIVVAAGATLSVAAFAIGGGLRVAGGGKEDDASALEEELLAAGSCPGICQEVHDTYASADSLNNASTGLFVTGAGLVVGTIAYALFAAPGDSEAATASPIIIPALGPNFAGLSATASF